MAQFKPSSRWQFFCQFRKEWVNCTAEEDQNLKDAYLCCSEEAPAHYYTVNGLKIKADFSRMMRINLTSDRSFELKLVGGQLPFTPPGPAAKKMRGRRRYMITEPAEKAEDDKVEEKPQESASKAADLDLEFVPNMSGKFEVSLNLEDRDDWGKVLIYKMLEAGVDMMSIDPRYLIATDKRGRSTSRNREELREMLDVARSYPVKVTYNPPDRLHPSRWHVGERPGWELDSLLMYFIKASITVLGAVQYAEIKYRWHKCIFQRYQLYVAEGDFWNTEMPLTQEEFYTKFPQLAPEVSLAIKVGPRLRDVFRGKEEILNLLFGGSG
jgi:hypothetical protein